MGVMRSDTEGSAADWLAMLPPASEPDALPLRHHVPARLPRSVREARATEYRPELAAIALDALARGVDVSRAPGMPSGFQLARWRLEHPEVDAAYRLAIELRADAMLARAEGHALDEAMPAQEAKLRADVLMKAAGLRSRRYAPTRGQDDVEPQRRDLGSVTDAELAAVVAEARALPAEKIMAEGGGGPLPARPGTGPYPQDPFQIRDPEESPFP